MTIEDRYRMLQDKKYREDLERQKYLGAAQSAASQVEASIEKLRTMVERMDDVQIRGMFGDPIAFYDKDKLLDKQYAAELFRKAQAVEAAIEKFADELVSV